MSVLSPLDFIDRVKRGAVIWKECGGLESNRGARSESEMVGINWTSLAAAAGKYIYSNHLCPLIVLYAWELFFCYHFKRNSAARKAVRKTEELKKTIARKHIPIPKSATPRDQLSPNPLVGDVNEECVCGAGASDGFPDGWTCGVSRPRSLLHVPSSASTVAEWSVALSWVRVPAPGGEPLRTFPVGTPWFWDFWGLGPVVKWNQEMWVVSGNVKRSIGGNLGEHI